MSISKPSVAQALLVAGLFVFLTAAVFSAGYHHPDEHFQILEFANFKLGGAPASDLPWEFQARIRPALQPTLAWLAIEALHGLGLQNPFTQALIFRVLSALLSVFLFWKLAQASAKTLPAKNGPIVLLFLAFLLWFMPYLQVRFSSECWSGLAFLAAVFYLLKFDGPAKGRTTALFIGGIFLGISFFFRFQMGFAILGVFAWLCTQKPKIADIFAFIAGGVLVGLACVALDCWFYDELVFTPFQYLKANIFENKAADWGVSPWWFYVSDFVSRAAPPISLILLGLFFYGIFLQRKHLFSWALVPYVLAHCMVGHKEMRFLFPMVFPFLFFVAAAWVVVRERFLKNVFLKSALYISLVINFILLLVRSVSPAQEAVTYFHFLYDYSEKRPVTIFSETEPAFQLVGLKMNFYSSKNARLVPLKSFDQLNDSTGIQPTPGDLLLSKNLKPPALDHGKLRRVYTFFPEWVLQNNVNNWQDRSRIWSIFVFE